MSVTNVFYDIRDEIKNVVELCSIKAFKTMLEITLFMEPAIP